MAFHQRIDLGRILPAVDRQRDPADVALGQAGGQLHRHAATLLNISPEGIACRLEQSAADAIERRATLTAIFELPSCDQPFHLRALVSNKTPASEGCSIIGLQFLRSEREIRELAALRRALEHDQNAEATARA